MNEKSGRHIFKLSFSKIVFIGFALIILIGGLLLMLPFATVDGEKTTFLGAMFTSTSATCVTGLVMYDTGTHWTAFGQGVILLLIQIGGLGFLTMISLFFIMMKHDVGLKQRMLIMQSTGALDMGGILPYVMRIAKGTLIFEGVGAVLLATRFIPAFGIGKGIYYSVFHSVSAFCNAGFDLLGGFNSLTGFKSDIVVNVTIMLLIIIGGIGFIVWSDIISNKHHFSKYRLHTKIVLVTSAVLVFGGAVLYYIFERNASLGNLSEGEKVLASFFQSVTMRTAGFNTIDLAQLSKSGSLLCCFLMFVGGSPGSTAGGLKTTTLAILFLAAVASARRKKDVTVFKRKLDQNDVLTATSVGVLYITIIFIITMIIAAVDDISLRKLVFEVVSAENTVGVTMGITRDLSAISQTLIMALMFIGRIGGFTLALLFLEGTNPPPKSRPTEKMLVG